MAQQNCHVQKQTNLRFTLEAYLQPDSYCIRPRRNLASAEAGDAFTGVRSKGAVRCGVSDGLLGFSLREPNGRWSGLGADFCRAVSAAALGDSGKVVFVPLITSARFLALRTGQIDVLARHTTWTLGRAAGLGVHFTGILYYDGQGFMVMRKSGIGKIDNLNGATICVETETTSKENLDDYFQARGWKYQPVLVKSLAEAMAAFFAGNCRPTLQTAASLLRQG